jgi:outer membrane usher protein
MLNNQVIGTTDAKGNLFLPNLIPYYGNRISIDPVDVPLDREVGAVEKFVATPLRGGALVRFDAPRLTMLTGELAIEEGGVSRVPAFGELIVHTERGERVSPIGRTGQFALENLPAGKHPAQIETENGVCELELQVPETTGQIDLGHISCTARPRVARQP